jgi:hypothetical protein
MSGIAWPRAVRILSKLPMRLASSTPLTLRATPRGSLGRNGARPLDKCHCLRSARSSARKTPPVRFDSAAPLSLARKSRSCSTLPRPCYLRAPFIPATARPPGGCHYLHAINCPPSFGSLLIALRVAAAMSGDKLASRSSSSRAFVEHGLVPPLIDTLAEIALRSGCRVEQGPHRQRRKHRTDCRRGADDFTTASGSPQELPRLQIGCIQG